MWSWHLSHILNTFWTNSSVKQEFTFCPRRVQSTKWCDTYYVPLSDCCFPKQHTAAIRFTIRSPSIFNNALLTLMRLFSLFFSESIKPTFSCRLNLQISSPQDPQFMSDDHFCGPFTSHTFLSHGSGLNPFELFTPVVLFSPTPYHLFIGAEIIVKQQRVNFGSETLDWKTYTNTGGVSSWF